MAQPPEESRQVDLLVKAAELYYEFGMTQEEVAAHLNVSRPTVSRLLRQARERGIVRIAVVNPKSRAGELERRLVETFGQIGRASGRESGEMCEGEVGWHN